MENTFDRASRRLQERLYHSAAGDYLVFLWQTGRTDPRTAAARDGLRMCGQRLWEQRFYGSARSIFQKLMQYAPETTEDIDPSLLQQSAPTAGRAAA